jgi:hypothetical protein
LVDITESAVCQGKNIKKNQSSSGWFMISVLTNFDAKKIMDMEGSVSNRSNEESKSKAVIFA